MGKYKTTILDQLQQAQYPIVAPCNGQKICGKCKIVMDNDIVPNDTEKRLLSETDLSAGIRLACTRPASSIDIVKLVHNMDQMTILSNVTLPENTSPYVSKIKVKDDYHLYRFGAHVSTSTSPKIYAIIIDIGTTTCAVILLDMIAQQVVEERSFINPQSSFGSDVIHRIQYASTDGNLMQLQSLIVNQLEQSIDSLLESNRIDPNDLTDIIVAGNTTMNYLLLGYPPHELAQAPYHASHTDQETLTYTELFYKDRPAMITVLGSFDAFVGGDILSGIYALDMHHEKDYHMLVDLGTNGEIVLGNKDKLYTASTAAGPAFEGVNITHGIGAIPGAIDQFEYPDNISTIQNKLPNGICGSGLIDIVSELLQHNIIQSNGYMKEDFVLTENISLTPSDVREVQLAKAAIRAGIEHLINVANITTNDIKKLYIAGGFGHHINFDSLKHLAMIPAELHDKIKIVGNTSLAGTAKYLFREQHNELTYIKDITNVVNLGTSKAFQDLFIDHISFDS